jgi:hypothetical protein
MVMRPTTETSNQFEPLSEQEGALAWVLERQPGAMRDKLPEELVGELLADADTDLGPGTISLSARGDQGPTAILPRANA